MVLGLPERVLGQKAERAQGEFIGPSDDKAGLALPHPFFHASDVLQHGRHDPLVPVARSRALAHELEEHGVPLVYTEYPMEHQVALERMLQPHGGLAGELAGVGDDQGALPRDQFGEVNTVYIGHDQEVDALMLTRIMCGDDVGVLQAANGADFALEAGDVDFMHFCRGQHLQGDNFAQFAMPGLVYSAHAALAELAENLVLAQSSAGEPVGFAQKRFTAAKGGRIYHLNEHGGSVPRDLVGAAISGERGSQSFHDQAERKSLVAKLCAAKGQYRAFDPFLNVKDRFIVRRIAADSRKADLGEYADAELNGKLLHAMGFDIAAVHAAAEDVRLRIRNDLAHRPVSWLYDAAKRAAASVETDFAEWAR